tara:strand:- start:3047 stop:3781 length:735 start_codon:yes stop_codon:yes gene_type:complete
MKPLKLLIDADYFIYRAAAASEIEMDYSQDLTIVVGDFSQGKKIIQYELSQLCERFDSKDILLALTDQKNFRKCIDETYKGNRVKRKPAGYLKLKDWVMFTYPSVMKYALEADDVCGILATNGSLENFVLISPDKDMEQIPCRIYNLKDEFTQTPEDAELKLWLQALSGDQTDGYGGCKGIGPKKAAQILSKKGEKSYWEVIVKAYKDAEQTEEDALRNLRLAKILQAEDWDAEKQQPILITPQ